MNESVEDTIQPIILNFIIISLQKYRYSTSNARNHSR